MRDFIPVEELLRTAIRAARIAGELLRTEYHAIHDGGKRLEIREKTAPNDLVTHADRAAQETIIVEIRKSFPDHRFIAEENGAESLGERDCPYAWIIDPLDGTLNFIHGRDNFGSIVAVEHSGEILAGAMHIPLLGHFFHGARGMGAYHNDTPVRLRMTKNMRDAILCSNSIRRAKTDSGGVLQISTPDCASLENYGSAIAEIGEVLRGHNDGVFFESVKIWDIAAGFLLIEEAGGTTRYEFSEPGNMRSGVMCAASTAPVFEELWEWVQSKM